MSLYNSVTFSYSQMLDHLKSMYEMMDKVLKSRAGIVDPNMPFLELFQKQLAISNPACVWKAPSIRSYFRPAFVSIMSKICGLYELYKASDILEVGCGTLNSMGESHISSCVSEHIASQFTYTDLNGAVNGFKKPRFIAADVTQLSKRIQKNHFDVVIGSCALDAIPTNKLAQAIKEIAQVLRKNGLLISVSDFYPYLNSILYYYTNKGMIIFPLVDEDKTFQGLQIITPDQLDSFLKSCTLNGDEKKFIDWYRNLSMLRRDQILTQVCISNEKIDVETSYLLSNWMVMHKIEGAQVIKNEEFYHEHLRAGLAGADMKIRTFKCMSSSFIKPGQDTRYYNVYADERGHVRTRRIYVLAPGHMYYNLSVNVVVAEKVK